MVGLSNLLKISLDQPEKQGIVENQHSKKKTCRDKAFIEKQKSLQAATMPGGGRGCSLLCLRRKAVHRGLIFSIQG